MALFNTSQLAILFQLILAKAGKTPQLKDFKDVSAKIGKDLQLTDTDISPEYLRKQHNKITQALQRGDMEIGFKPEHLNICCQFIGFASYEEFKKHCDKILKHLDARSLQTDRLHLFYSEKDRQYILEKLEGCFYPGQERSVEQRMYADNFKQLFEEFLKLQKDGGLMVWCLPLEDVPSEQISQIKAFLQKEPPAKNLVPLHPEDDGENPFSIPDPLYEADSFHLAVALGHGIVQQLEQQRKTGNTDEGAGVSIHNPNQVVMGDVHIKGEYISQNDMYITINKEKK